MRPGRSRSRPRSPGSRCSIHSNGFSQYNAQRYALDWLPLLFVFLPAAFGRLDATLMRVLVLWAMTLNLATLAVLQATRVAA